ncbi:MAG: SGNH/GDSL hydrolase family protein [Eubacteriales bacterium]|nr:SGNH/GDSL hydrolase family protein [Eubacteriales bacterium]
MDFKNVAQLHNIAEISCDEQNNEYVMSRIPFALREKLNAAVKKRCLAPAGSEIRFNINSGSAKVVLRFIEERGVNKGQPVIAEVYQGCFRIGCYALREEATEIIITPAGNTAKLREISQLYGHPFDAGLTRILLPDTAAVRLIDISGDIRLPEAGQTPAGKYLAYGSSITNGSFALAPSSTYPTKTAAILGKDLFNLGFGGGAHLEPEMADYIAERNDWDFTTLETGINILGIDEAEFDKRVRYFVRRIAAAHPAKWVFCTGIFTFSQDFDVKAKKGKKFREIVKQAVTELNMPKVIYADGRELLRDPAGLSPDLVHPVDSGFTEIAANLAGLIKRYMINDK